MTIKTRFFCTIFFSTIFMLFNSASILAASISETSCHEKHNFHKKPPSDGYPFRYGIITNKEGAKNKSNNGLISLKTEEKLKHKLPKPFAGKRYYVSPSGNDGNNGLSILTAWRTINKINTTNFNSDTILLDGSLSGVINLGVDDLSSTQAPIVIKSYSSRATVEGMLINNIGGVEVHNLTIAGSGAGMNTKDGILIYKDNATALTHIYLDSIEVFGFGGRGVVVGAWNTTIGFDDVRITHVSAHDNGRSGIESYGYNNLYLHTNIYVGYCQSYHNLGVLTNFTEPTGNGIALSCVDGALIENSSAWGNGSNNRNNGGGPVGIWFYNVKNGVIQNCESYQNQAGLQRDGGGFDIDGGCQNCTIQNCISHDNEGPGYLLAEYGSTNVYTNNSIKNNISTNDGLKNNTGSLTLWAMDANHYITNAIVESNIVNILATSPAINIVETYFSNVIIRNNSFYVQATTEQVRGSASGVALTNNTFIIPGVLPVNLLFFSAQKSNHVIKLKWKASVETALSYYQIERRSSVDYFNAIGYRKASTGNLPAEYVYLDSTYNNAQTVFYRLKMIDKNGTYSYSNILSITQANNMINEVVVAPNPVQDKVSLYITSAAEKNSEIKIIDYTGKEVLTKFVSIASGNNYITLDETAGFSKGIYWLSIRVNNEQTIIKFIK